MLNESKTTTKYILCNCKCKFDGEKCSLNQKWSNDKCRCECKNPARHHLKSIVDDLVITCDEIIDVSNIVSINLNYEKATCKMDNYYILLYFTLFLLVTILLLIATICYYYIKNRSKQINILP